MEHTSEISFSSTSMKKPAFPYYPVPFSEVEPPCHPLPLIFSPTLEERVKTLPHEIRLRILGQFDDVFFSQTIAPWLAEEDGFALMQRARDMELDVSDEDSPSDVAELMRFLSFFETNPEDLIVNVDFLSPYVQSKIKDTSFTRDFCTKPEGRWKQWRTVLAEDDSLSCPCKGQCNATFTAMRELDIPLHFSDDALLWGEVMLFKYLLPDYSAALEHIEQFPHEIRLRFYQGFLRCRDMENYHEDPSIIEMRHSDELFKRVIALKPSEEHRENFKRDLNLFFCRMGGDRTAWDEGILDSAVHRLFVHTDELRLPVQTSSIFPPCFPVRHIMGETPHTYHTIIWLAAHIEDLEQNENERFASASFSPELREKILSLPVGDEKRDLLWRHGFFFSSGKWTWKDFFTDVSGDIYNLLKEYFTMTGEADVNYPEHAPALGWWAEKDFEIPVPLLRCT